jgi:hypothetical protein
VFQCAFYFNFDFFFKDSKNMLKLDIGFMSETCTATAAARMLSTLSADPSLSHASTKKLEILRSVSQDDALKLARRFGSIHAIQRFVDCMLWNFVYYEELVV